MAMTTVRRATAFGDLAPELFRDMVEQWPGAVVMVNRDGVIRWANEAAHDWAPAGAGALIGGALTGLAVPWLREQEDLVAVLAGGARQFDTRVLVDRRGRERHCGARLVPLRRGQAICGALLYIDDVPAPEGSTVVQAPSISDTARAVALGAAQVGAWHRNLQTGEGGRCALVPALRLDPQRGRDPPGLLKADPPDDMAASTASPARNSMRAAADRSKPSFAC